MRAAIYFTPPAGSVLAKTAAHWLGRNPFDGEPTRAPDKTRDPLVTSPARYGFHATIVAPFRLAGGVELETVDARLAEFCAAQAPFSIIASVPAQLGKFVALVPAEPSAPLQTMAGAAVRAFNPFRAPLNDEEIAKRRPETLSQRQGDYLTEWGYPYVFDEFRFHMTLSNGLSDSEAKRLRPDLKATFKPFDGEPLMIDQLAIFTEAERGAPFRVHSVHRFENA
ncbi:DUF1045 domain-containing protein [Jiella sp. MQZ9-1]|uniref:DUF1045 domain-containing protein n=1 Tax=Jiella flava TaxID=2816857 RepID=A0A939JT57_9HYPH|nr:DUF1045 domain-containing protein [Jiella flava]MBO0661790.1 DUF1045 domain-containing protein [Jiella flava]MCD2470431.1 DUF1045 domain-containing protein [Jiella flava]